MFLIILIINVTSNTAPDLHRWRTEVSALNTYRSNVLITSIAENPKSPTNKLPEKKYQVYVIEDAVPPTTFSPE